MQEIRSSDGAVKVKIDDGKINKYSTQNKVCLNKNNEEIYRHKPIRKDITIFVVRKAALRTWWCPFEEMATLLYQLFQKPEQTTADQRINASLCYRLTQYRHNDIKNCERIAGAWLLLHSSKQVLEESTLDHNLPSLLACIWN